MTSVSNSLPIHIGVMGLPINAHKQFLLTLRHEPQIPEFHNKWQLTGGGVEPGENHLDTLNREFLEELSVTPTILYPHPIVKTHIWNLKSHSSHIILLCYLVDLGHQTPRITNKENTDFGWFSPHQIKDLDCLPLCHEFISESTNIIQTHNLYSKLVPSKP